jgi:Arc/MetJ-type ribon-helix-helix transcriptional regulator
MAAERVTVSLPAEVLAGARGAVDAGAADSLSAFVAEAVRHHLKRARALAELARVLGGPPPLHVREQVRRDLGLGPVPPLSRAL